MLLVSWIAAVVACLAYGVATVLQSVGARRAATATGVGGVIGIVTQLPYLAGLALDGVGFVGNVVALRQLPLFLVEAIVAGSVGVTAVLAALRGERLRGRDWAALGVLGLGLVLLSISAAPAEASATSLTRDWLILCCALLPLVVGLVGYRTGGPSVRGAARRRRRPGLQWGGRGLTRDGCRPDHLGPSAQSSALGDHRVRSSGGRVLRRRSAAREDHGGRRRHVRHRGRSCPRPSACSSSATAIADGRLPYAVAGFVLAIGGTIALSRFAE